MSAANNVDLTALRAELDGHAAQPDTGEISMTVEQWRAVSAVLAIVTRNTGKPARRMKLVAALEGDDRADLVHDLFELGRSVDRKEINTWGIRGGSHSGWIVFLSEDPTMTHEEYFRQVDVYLAERNGGADQ